MPVPGRQTLIAPGPQGRKPLPPPPPAGTLPEDTSPLWNFTPRSVRLGEAFIQSDTEEYLTERNFIVPVSRAYVDHPRWLIQNTRTVRGDFHNSAIVAEVHMALRRHHGRPLLPDWVPARLTAKSEQASIAYRITRMAHKAVLKHGEQSMDLWAEKAPGQFLKWVSSTFIPRKLEVSAELPENGDEMSRDQVEAVLGALKAELERRELEARMIEKNRPGDLPDLPDPSHTLELVATELSAANGNGSRLQARGVVDLITPGDELDNGMLAYAVEGKPSLEEWD